MNCLPKPEFVIIGAMKCGTSSLHRALEQHPRVFIPEGEMKYYSVDDLEQQATFFRHQENQWIAQDFEANKAADLTYYQKCYEDYPADAVIGEDAPSYLCIPEVAERLYRHIPEVKLIVALRDPVARTYSHYWHNVATYRSHYTFEDSLRYAQENLLRRSYYQEQIESYLQVFSREQLHFVLFEEFIRDQQAVLSGILEFLGLSSFSFTKVHANRTPYPKRLGLTLIRNYFQRDAIGRRYRGVIPGFDHFHRPGLKERIAYKLDRWFNCYGPEYRRAIRLETASMLAAYLRRKNAGLGNLIGRDLAEFWKTFS